MDSVKSDQSVIVIGAGVAGLTRALALADAGKKVMVIDPRPPGGVMKTLFKEGFTLECGPNTLVLTPEVAALLQRVGIEDKVRLPVIPRYRQYVWFQGAPELVPRSPSQILGSKLLPGIEKFRAVRGIFKRSSVAKVREGASVDEVFSELLSPHIATHIVAPVLRGIFGGDTTKLVAAEIFPKLWAHLAGGGCIAGYVRSRMGQGKRSIFSLEGGNASLIDAMTRALSGRTEVIESSIAMLAVSEGGSYDVTLTDGRTLTSDAVVVATSGAATATFIGGLSPSLQGLLVGMRYAPVVVIHLAINKNESLLDKGFGLLFPPSSGPVMGVLFNSKLFPHVAPPHESLVTVCMGGVQNPEQIELSEEELGNAAKLTLARSLGVKSARVLNVVKWPKGIPQYERSLSVIHAEMRKVEQCYPGITFIGADRGGIGVPARVETAWKT